MLLFVRRVAFETLGGDQVRNGQEAVHYFGKVELLVVLALVGVVSVAVEPLPTGWDLRPGMVVAEDIDHPGRLAAAVLEDQPF